MKKLKTSELNRLSIEDFQKSEKNPVVVVLDNIRSMNNIGSAFRTCDAFRVQQLYLCGITATPPHREIQKTALDATESVDWKYFSSTLDAILELRRSGYHIIALEHTNSSRPIQEYEIPEESKIALIFGNEVEGVNEEVLALADACLEIPQFGTKHSINVAVAVGITLWEVLRKMKKV